MPVPSEVISRASAVGPDLQPGGNNLGGSTSGESTPGSNIPGGSIPSDNIPSEAPNMVPEQKNSAKQAQPWLRLSLLASVKLTILLMSLIATTVLIGAWCPQESQVGKQKVIEQFGPQVGQEMIRLGIADIFHSPWFLGLIGMLTVNMVACSFQRVFPKVRLLTQPMVYLGQKEIAKMPAVERTSLALTSSEALDALQAKLQKSGYTVVAKGNKLTAHWGKFGRLAATVTHIGLLSLLGGVTITSWTGFTGFQSIPLGSDLSFEESEHSKQWLGHLPPWRVHVAATRRENYDSGDPKQWYSTLSVIGPQGKVLTKQEISVNTPLEYQGVDIYQSSWGLQDLIVKFNGTKQTLPLRPMGKVYAAFLPLDQQTVLVFSVRGQDQPVRVFAKIPEWPQPHILTVLSQGHPTSLGNVKLELDSIVPVTGLQYKSDPGLPVTYVAFGFIIVGVMMAAVPYRQLWACVEPLDDNSCELVAGGVSKKAKAAFEKSLRKIVAELPGQMTGTGVEKMKEREEQECRSFS